jgi:hypothetical protein
MIELIGLGTLLMLVWVLASSMATESEAEKRRVAVVSAADLLNVARRARRGPNTPSARCRGSNSSLDPKYSSEDLIPPPGFGAPKPRSTSMLPWA